MKVRLDTDACQGHGRCFELAPGVFDSDDYGDAVLLDASGAVPSEHEEAARLAVANCPEGALELVED